MPTSERQRKAAGSELKRRRSGIKRQRKGSETRPFGSAKVSVLRTFASKKGHHR